MRCRRNAGEVELGHLGDGVEDRGELGRQPVDLVLAQVEAREPRDVHHRVPVDRHPTPILSRRRAPSGARRTKLESGKPRLP